MWSYFKLMIHIWEAEPNDDDGFEQYVRRELAKSKINWIPTNTYLGKRDDDLEAADDTIEKIKANLKADLDHFSDELSAEMGVFSEKLNLQNEDAQARLIMIEQVGAGSGRVGSDRVGSGRVGSDRVGSGRVGQGRVGPG